jgi:hypothetical protein
MTRVDVCAGLCSELESKRWAVEVGHVKVADRRTRTQSVAKSRRGPRRDVSPPETTLTDAGPPAAGLLAIQDARSLSADFDYQSRLTAERGMTLGPEAGEAET